MPWGDNGCGRRSLHDGNTQLQDGLPQMLPVAVAGGMANEGFKEMAVRGFELQAGGR